MQSRAEFFIQAATKMVVALSCFMFAANPAHAALVDDLLDGQHVLLMRHADAPGVGDPPGYKLDQCETQRNLGDVGRKQSVEIGRWLVSQGVVNPRLFSSAWCRCLDTARLMSLGSVSVEPSLNSFFDEMSLAKRQTIALQEFVSKRLKTEPKQPLILITHHVNIEAFTGRIVGVGDMVLVRVNADGSHVSHQLFPSPRP